MSMSAGIAAARRRWDSPLADAATNTNLETHLTGAPVTRHLYVEVAAPHAVGGVSAEAVSAGDLSAFVRVELGLRGEAQGYGGAISGGSGGDAIDANNQSNLTITVFPTGAIRGGGSGAGSGGKGGWGQSQGSTSTRAFDYKFYQYGFGGGISDPSYGVYWAGAYKGLGTGTGLCPGDGYFYRAGDYAQTPSLYAVKRSVILNNDNGYGGAGGKGQGYLQTKGNGNAGIDGTGGCGIGGAGGVGGNWAVAGTTGGAGSTGYKYATDGQLDVVADAGSPGNAAGAAGAAVINVTGVTIVNYGTIDGAYT